ncbi:MAG: hypothetical protein HKN82_18150 [Akkermansiaceae bacterium]|nr:hypothetical protein [Akkermansiaceae bacterium]
MRTEILAVLLGCLPVAASTIEVVRLFQPLSLHGTDGSGDEDEAGEPLQAAVMPRPFALGGAIPEDLVKAVARPCEIGTNSPGYEVQESNLIILCGIGLAVSFEEESETLVVTFDVKELSIPEDVDLTARQVLKLSIRAVQRSLEDYFSHGEHTLKWKVAITGTKDGNASLKNMGKEFLIAGKKQDDPPGVDEDGG